MASTEYRLHMLAERQKAILDMYDLEYGCLLDRIRHGERVTARELFRLLAREHVQLKAVIDAYAE